MYAQVDPKNVSKVIKLMKNEVEKIVEKGITEEEYERSRKSVSSHFIFSGESPANKASIYGGTVLEDHENETREAMLEKYMNVTLEDVNKAAKEIFSHHPKFRVLSNDVTDEQILNAWNS